jgi:hypothetical protein
MMVKNNLVGGIPTNPSEKSESVGMMAFPTEWKVIIQSCSKPLTSLSSIHGLFAIEIVDLPSYKMVIFHSFLYVYQRVHIPPFMSFTNHYISRCLYPSVDVDDFS